MRSDALYLQDIVEASEAVSRFIGFRNQAEFAADDILRSAVLLKLLNIGEAVRQMSEATKAENPEVPWKVIAGFRNRTIHEYFSVDWQIVWETAIGDLPPLRAQIQAILDKEFG